MEVGRYKPSKLTGLYRGKRNKEDLSDMNKGHVKVNKGIKVFKTISRDPDKYRSVNMHDGKNTVLLIRKTDRRTDEQIRDWFFKNT
ncbi:hypothetical protein ORI89_16775 [Sphingobacterium sp. UT-1RO-CII-1]|uniref:hypothetical protein n=1 Tax=Sphingobacterium sp. UT-1RO-CII-1 TaxID=2995225 RepID=UPI00227C0967|nr:hypothetical protein [Sphingobacterium sp. UT-1RO-CII-1]MCY4781314.1 hypothetical protein [Sphingobacterium sp. UT-1RO-CII-1]